MPCANLKGEMAKKGVTIEEISKLLQIHRNSVANKINGDSAFTIDEAFKIKNRYFPMLSLNYLFSKEEDEEAGGKERERRKEQKDSMACRVQQE